MQLIPELLNSPEALFAGKILLALSMFLCSYAIISKVASTIFKSNRMVSHGLAIVIGLYAFQVPFPPSGGPIPIPLTWQLTGLFNVIVLLISLAMVKYASGFGLMTAQLEGRKVWVASVLAALFIFAIFLTFIVQLLRVQLGEFYSLAFNLSWLLDFGLTIVGAVNGVFGVFRETTEWIIGNGHLAQVIPVVFIIVSIVVIPQLISYGSIITKVASTLGIITASFYRRG